MTPLQIEILFWYYGRVGDYRAGDFSAPAVREAIDEFRDVTHMLEPEQASVRHDRTYRLSERGLAYITHLMSVPLPVCTWVIAASCATPPDAVPGIDQ